MFLLATVNLFPVHLSAASYAGRLSHTALRSHARTIVFFFYLQSEKSDRFLPRRSPWNYSRRPNNGITEEEARSFAAAERATVVEFLQGCDLAIMDTQHTDEEYTKHIGWGHSSLSSVVSFGLDSNVGKLLLFHYDPNHDDEMIDKMVEHARACGKEWETLGSRSCSRRR